MHSTTNPTRPMAQKQRRIIGTAKAEGHPVDLIAIANDLMTGRTFYVIAGRNGGAPFGVWPEELQDIAWSMPIGA